MLLYLYGNIWQDIVYAMNCCIRYMFNPHCSHEIALKQIGPYLKATCKKGLIINPCKKLSNDLLLLCMCQAGALDQSSETERNDEVAGIYLN